MTQAEMMARKGYMTAADAGRKIGRARYTVQRWVEEGKVEGMRVGARIYVNTESLRRYVGDAASLLGFKGGNT